MQDALAGSLLICLHKGVNPPCLYPSSPCSLLLVPGSAVGRPSANLPGPLLLAVLAPDSWSDTLTKANPKLGVGRLGVDPGFGSTNLADRASPTVLLVSTVKHWYQSQGRHIRAEISKDLALLYPSYVSLVGLLSRFVASAAHLCCPCGGDPAKLLGLLDDLLGRTCSQLSTGEPLVESLTSENRGLFSIAGLQGNPPPVAAVAPLAGLLLKFLPPSLLFGCIHQPLGAGLGYFSTDYWWEWTPLFPKCPLPSCELPSQRPPSAPLDGIPVDPSSGVEAEHSWFSSPPFHHQQT
ncbi:hypothetical protein DSO57_1033223 [Entomophthora muscae]|uniref:Uncharacterized protein n=1 Tax=Entomophthora muscae TaxID=34485 RepID=A0ACC2TYB7_9FUNG|nr:hypothetical protein DSO57_1033223 [Entomophthora muscae]